MLPVKIESDDDRYIPSGLLNSADSSLGRNAIKTNEIFEFYNVNKPSSGVIEKSSRESDVFVDLSKNSSQPATPRPPAPPQLSVSQPEVKVLPTSTTRRVLTLQPGSNPPQLPSDIPKPPLLTTRSYVPRTIQVAPRRNVYRQLPIPMPVQTMYPFVGRQMFHPPQLNPYQQTGMMGMKLPQPAIMPPPPPPNVMNPNAVCNPPYVPPIHPQMNPMGHMMHPGMMLVSHVHPMMHPMNVFPYLPPFFQKPPEPIMPPEETKPRISPEKRKQIREEAAAKLKAERLARKAQLKAQKNSEKAKVAAAKRKHDALHADSGHRKFGNFSKDMFVIRLKDVDSFDRNNEIWRIDNHILIQKFCGVPSLRSPARQFQSTYKLSGYDSRATWRLFIINPDSVEIDRDGTEVTIHNFPSINVLREAKQLAEMKDDAFKEIEKSEYQEKLRKSELKQNSRMEARLRRRFERKQKKLNKEKESFSCVTSNTILWNSMNNNFVRSSTAHTMISHDDYICRDIINGMLDALDDEYYDDGESFATSDEESDFSDEEEDEEGEEEEEEEEKEEEEEEKNEEGEEEIHDNEKDENEDAGSLISLAHSSDHEHDTLYSEHELPSVAVEVVIE